MQQLEGEDESLRLGSSWSIGGDPAASTVPGQLDGSKGLEFQRIKESDAQMTTKSTVSISSQCGMFKLALSSEASCSANSHWGSVS